VQHRTAEHNSRRAASRDRNAAMAEQTAAAPKPRPSWVKPLERPLEVLGELSLFTGQSVMAIARRPYRVGLLMVQLEFMAYGSMFVVGLTGLFTGMVLALQTVYAFGLFNAQSLVGATVEISLARELAPIFTCIVLVARVGSAAATELGTMRVTEQIDALETMAVDPLNYLVAPRIGAAALAAPPAPVRCSGLGVWEYDSSARSAAGDRRPGFVQEFRWVPRPDGDQSEDDGRHHHGGARRLRQRQDGADETHHGPVQAGSWAGDRRR